MNRRRLWIVLALAAVSGVAAAFVSVDYLRTQTGPMLESRQETSRVAVAVRNLPQGATVTAEDVRMMDWPSDMLPPGFASMPEEVVGRGVINRIAMNEPFIAGKLADKAEGAGLPIVIPEGMRALSVRVDDVISVAGFVVPGTRVDVIVTASDQNSGGGRTSRVILQNIQALAAGQTVQQNEKGEPMTVSVITLLVTPEQAELLTLASNEGRIQLALRNTLDGEDVETDGMRAVNLLGGSGLSPARSSGSGTRVVRSTSTPPPVEQPSVVEIFKGGEKTLTRF